DNGIVAALEIVVAQAAVARHVDTEHEQAALSYEIRVDDGLDHRYRNAYRCSALHRVEHFFGKSGFCRGDLQLRLAGDAIDGAAEGEQHALIRGVHADEDGDAEHYACGGEQCPQHVPAEVRPANQPEERHVHHAWDSEALLFDRGL